MDMKHIALRILDDDYLAALSAKWAAICMLFIEDLDDTHDSETLGTFTGR